MYSECIFLRNPLLFALCIPDTREARDLGKTVIQRQSAYSWGAPDWTCRRAMIQGTHKFFITKQVSGLTKHVREQKGHTGGRNNMIVFSEEGGAHTLPITKLLACSAKSQVQMRGARCARKSTPVRRFVFFSLYLSHNPPSTFPLSCVSLAQKKSIPKGVTPKPFGFNMW